MTIPPLSIMILDACSDKNAGDAAMQLALRDLIADSAPGSHVLVAARFGCNQGGAALKELESFTGSPNVAIMAGDFPTFVHFKAEEARASALRRKLGKAWAAASILPLLLALSVGAMPLARLLARWQGKNIVAKAENSDFIIWNGRNFRRIDGLRGLFKLVELVANPAFAATTTTPKSMYGVSFWPVKTALARAIVRGVMRHYDRIYVRETESLRLAKEIGLTNAALMPDLSFYHLTKLHERKPRPAGNLSERPAQAALTLVAQRELNRVLDQNDYIQMIAATVAHLKARYGLKVVIARQVTYGPELEDKMIARVQEACGPLEVLPAPRCIDDLLDVYAQSRILLATRMHSAIFAMSCGTPVVTLPYDWKGKWQILADLGLPAPCMIPLSEAEATKIIAGVDTAMRDPIDWTAIAANIESNGQRLHAMVQADLADAHERRS